MRRTRDRPKMGPHLTTHDKEINGMTDNLAEFRSVCFQGDSYFVHSDGHLKNEREACGCSSTIAISNKVLPLQPFSSRPCYINQPPKMMERKVFQVSQCHNIKYIFLRIPLPNQSGQQSYSFHVHPCSVPRCTELFIPYQHTSTRFSAP